MTVEELRNTLFSIDNQEMTVRELRNELFNLIDQKKEIRPELIMWLGGKYKATDED